MPVTARSLSAPLLAAALAVPMAVPVAAQGLPEWQRPEPMPRADELRLARSAAPPAVAERATIYVLGREGYEVAQQGTNGYTCVVERGTVGRDVMPICHDADGSATVVQIYLLRERMRAAGRSRAEYEDSLDAGYRSGRFRAPRAGGLSYMLARGYFINATTGKRTDVKPHVMTYAPYVRPENLGYTPADAARIEQDYGMFLLGMGSPGAYIVFYSVPDSASSVAASRGTGNAGGR